MTTLEVRKTNIVNEKLLYPPNSTQDKFHLNFPGISTILGSCSLLHQCLTGHELIRSFLSTGSDRNNHQNELI